MKLQDAITALTRLALFGRSKAPTRAIVIPIHNPGGLGGTPCVQVVSVEAGFDWDSGKVFLNPEHPLTALTAEQVADISKSVREGGSWHAYQQYKKQRERVDFLQAQLEAQRLLTARAVSLLDQIIGHPEMPTHHEVEYEAIKAAIVPAVAPEVAQHIADLERAALPDLPAAEPKVFDGLLK